MWECTLEEGWQRRRLLDESDYKIDSIVEDLDVDVCPSFEIEKSLEQAGKTRNS